MLLRLARLIRLVGVSGHAAVAVRAAPDPNHYVFLCLGQSNPEGFPGRSPNLPASTGFLT